MKDSTGVLRPAIGIRGCMLWPRYMAYFMSIFRLALKLLDSYTMFARGDSHMKGVGMLVGKFEINP